MAFNVIVASATFTRPADTTSYTTGDLVANNTVAGSVVPMQFTIARAAQGSFLLRRARLKKSSSTTTAAIFRLHLYGADPSASSGIANGDNAAWSTANSSYIGSFELDISGTTARTFTDSTAVIGIPTVGVEIGHELAAGQIAYGLLEARGSYAPASAEVFTVEIEAIQN